MKHFFLLLTGLFFFVKVWATGEPSTYFSIYVPPNNDPVKRNVCLIVTAIYDSTYFTIKDDSTDGDWDDSKDGWLMAGQSYVLYIKDNGINDDARYASGGVLKQDGDYFVITSTKLVYGSQSTDSDWQHDWVPSVNKKGIGERFIVYAPNKTSSNRDLNVFPFQDNTRVTIRKISKSPTIVTGFTNVDFNNEAMLVNTVLNVGQDLIYGTAFGRDLLLSGETYVVETDKPVTVQYGALYGNERDGGGYVPSNNGSSSGELFYFGVPFQSGSNGEQEIRISCWNDSNVVYLHRFVNNSWILVRTWNASKNQALEWVGRNNGNVNYPNVFRVTCTAGKKVSVFEADWLETGSPGTSDIGTMVSSDNGTSAGKYFNVYIPPPGNEHNVRDPFTNSLYGEQLSHLYVFARTGATVTVKDAYRNGADFSTTFTVLPGRYYDLKFNLSQWKDIYNGTGTVAGGPERPYVILTSDNAVSVFNTNFNDNWMCYFGSNLEQAILQSSTTSIDSSIPGSTFTLTTNVTVEGSSQVSDPVVQIKFENGLEPVSASFVNVTQSDTTFPANVQHNGNSTTVTFLPDYPLTSSETYKISSTALTQVVDNTGAIVPNNTIGNVETIVTGNVDGVLQQSVSSQGITLNTANQTLLHFTKVDYTGLTTTLTDSWNVSSIDLDADGDDDLVISNKNASAKLFVYRNDNPGFTLVNCINKPVTAIATSFGDIDNNGTEDMVIVNNNKFPVYLYKNNGNFSFSLVSATGINPLPGYYHYGGLVDLNSDGKLDLVLANYVETKFNEFYLNLGNFNFVKVENVISRQALFSLGLNWVDYNNDRIMDVFVPHSVGGKAQLFKGEGNGQFRDVSLEAGISDSANTVAAAWGDYDNDGDFDLYCANASNQNDFLYKNNGDGTFIKISNIVTASKGHSHGCGFMDFDNDGDLDLLVMNDKGVKNLFRNDGNDSFVSITNEAICGDFGKSFGLSFSDLDLDGDLDVVSTTHGNQADAVFKNNTNSSLNYLQVKLQGTVSNKSAIGASVKVWNNGVCKLRQVETNSGLGSQHSRVLHYGCGTSLSVDSITVDWPSGLHQVTSSYSVNQKVVITEPLGYHISANVFVDLNRNCIKEEGEYGAGGISFKIGNATCISGFDGTVNFYLLPGTHQLEVLSSNWRYACNSSTVTTVSANSDGNITLALEPVTAIYDVSIALSATAQRRGFKNDLNFLVRNEGTIISESHIAECTVPAGVTVFPEDGVVLLRNKLQFTVPVLLPGQQYTLVLKDSVSLLASLNSNLAFEALIVVNDDVALNNSVLLNEQVVGSVDPNCLVVSPRGAGEKGVILPQQELTYKVYFENLGNYYAEDVIVENSLPLDLDEYTFSNVMASHSFSIMQIGRKVYFVFNKIQLPSKLQDSVLNQGFVSYSVYPRTSVSEETAIINQASIKFDFEEPIKTNATLNTVRYFKALYDLVIAPNPSSSVFRVVVRNRHLLSDESIYKVELINALGVVVENKGGYNGLQSAEFNNSIVAGHYVVKVTLMDGAVLFGHLVKY